MYFACKYPNGLRHYKQIFQDRHRKRWKIGDWTDDTDMMLCIADAIIEDKGVNFLNSTRHSVWYSFIMCFNFCRNKTQLFMNRHFHLYFI